MSLLEKRCQGKETDLRPQGQGAELCQQQVLTASAAALQGTGVNPQPLGGSMPQLGCLGSYRRAETVPGGRGNTFIQEKCPS